MDVVRALFSLMLVLGMVAAAYFWLKRRGNMPGVGERRMRVVERLPIDSRRSILLLEVDGVEMVVGLGGDSLRTLKTLPREGDHAA